MDSIKHKVEQSQNRIEENVGDDVYSLWLT